CFITLSARQRSTYEPCSVPVTASPHSGRSAPLDGSDFETRARQHQLPLHARYVRLVGHHSLLHDPVPAGGAGRLSPADGLLLLAVPQRQARAAAPLRRKRTAAHYGATPALQ